MAIAFSVRTNSVSTTQPARAMKSQRPRRRICDPLCTPGRSIVFVGLCCRFIAAPGRCLHEYCLCMQAQLSCPVSYHIIVSKTLRQALRFFHQGMELRIETSDGPGHDVRMQNSTTEPMEASQQFCPNLVCTDG